MALVVSECMRSESQTLFAKRESRKIPCEECRHDDVFEFASLYLILSSPTLSKIDVL